jgi:hypothetical protein
MFALGTRFDVSASAIFAQNLSNAQHTLHSFSFRYLFLFSGFIMHILQRGADE